MSCNKNNNNVNTECVSDINIEGNLPGMKKAKRDKSRKYGKDRFDLRKLTKITVARLYRYMMHPFHRDEKFIERLHKTIKEYSPTYFKIRSQYVSFMSECKIIYNNILYIQRNPEVLNRMIYLFGICIKRKIFFKVVTPDMENFIRENRKFLTIKLDEYIQEYVKLLKIIDRGLTTAPKNDVKKEKEDKGSDKYEMEAFGAYLSILPKMLDFYRQFYRFTFKHWTLLSLDKLFLQTLYKKDAIFKKKSKKNETSQNQDSKQVTHSKSEMMLNEFMKSLLKNIENYKTEPKLNKSKKSDGNK